MSKSHVRDIKWKMQSAYGLVSDKPIRYRLVQWHLIESEPLNYHALGANFVFSDVGVKQRSLLPDSKHAPRSHQIMDCGYPNMEHAATLLEHAKLFSVYINFSRRIPMKKLVSRCNARQCQAFEKKLFYCMNSLWSWSENTEEIFLEKE